MNYDTPDPALQERRDRRLATGFSEDPEYENLLKLRRDDPARFEQIASPALHVALGGYQNQKAAAERLQRRSNR